MKKINFLSMMVLVVMALPIMVACGDDDGGSGRGVDYTTEEIVEILTGKWEIYGHVKVTSSNSDIIVKVDGDYTGTIEFMENQKVKAKSSEIEIKTTSSDGHTNTQKMTLAELIISGSEYTITRKNGAVHISFGTGSEDNHNDYKIVSLNKTNFKLVQDEMIESIVTAGDGKFQTVILHIEVTIISQ